MQNTTKKLFKHLDNQQKKEMENIKKNSYVNEIFVNEKPNNIDFIIPTNSNSKININTDFKNIFDLKNILKEYLDSSYCIYDYNKDQLKDIDSLFDYQETKKNIKTIYDMTYYNKTPIYQRENLLEKITQKDTSIYNFFIKKISSLKMLYQNKNPNINFYGNLIIPKNIGIYKNPIFEDLIQLHNNDWNYPFAKSFILFNSVFLNQTELVINPEILKIILTLQPDVSKWNQFFSQTTIDFLTNKKRLLPPFKSDLKQIQEWIPYLKEDNKRNNQIHDDFLKQIIANNFNIHKELLTIVLFFDKESTHIKGNRIEYNQWEDLGKIYWGNFSDYMRKGIIDNFDVFNYNNIKNVSHKEYELLKPENYLVLKENLINLIKTSYQSIIIDKEKELDYVDLYDSILEIQNFLNINQSKKMEFILPKFDEQKTQEYIKQGIGITSTSDFKNIFGDLDTTAVKLNLSKINLNNGIYTIDVINDKVKFKDLSLSMLDKVNFSHDFYKSKTNLITTNQTNFEDIKEKQEDKKENKSQQYIYSL